MSVSAQVLEGCVFNVLPTLEAGSVHCCVTSPPYWGLRDYGVKGQLGLEPTPELYVERMVELGRQIHRVLRDDGTWWLNIGDSYAGSGRGGYAGGSSTLDGSTDGQDIARVARTTQSRLRDDAMIPRSDVAVAGAKPKDMVGIPWLLAFALRADGWYLRQEIIWHKPNPMPESVRDRCTKAHEQLFLLSKSERYHFDADAIKEPVTCKGGGASFGKVTHAGEADAAGQQVRRYERPDYRETGRNKRGVWTVDDHRALLDWLAENRPEVLERYQAEARGKGDVWTVTTKPFSGAHFAVFPPALIEPCVLAGCPEGGTVLDPFGGSGTTGAVALKHGRNAVLVELNPEYAAIARDRIGAARDDAGLFMGGNG